MTTDPISLCLSLSCDLYFQCDSIANHSNVEGAVFIYSFNVDLVWQWWNWVSRFLISGFGGGHLAIVFPLNCDSLQDRLMFKINVPNVTRKQTTSLLSSKFHFSSVWDWVMGRMVCGVYLYGSPPSCHQGHGFISPSDTFQKHLRSMLVDSIQYQNPTCHCESIFWSCESQISIQKCQCTKWLYYGGPLLMIALWCVTLALRGAGYKYVSWFCVSILYVNWARNKQESTLSQKDTLVSP